MFYYFSPRCRVDGSLMVDGAWQDVADGAGWYDHEFGDNQRVGHGYQATVGWNWLAAQLDNGCTISAFDMFDRGNTARSRGRWVIVTSPSGERHAYDEFTFTGDAHWTSARTFNQYPTRYRLEVPRAGIELAIDAALAAQEMVTVISPPGFWEGRVDVRGTFRGELVTGLGFVERSGASVVDSTDEFFSSVGRETRRAIDELLPDYPTREQALALIGGAGRDHLLNGVDLEQYSRTLLRPIREMILRGGKAWRSYGVLACMDAVGGDAQAFLHWLALPELLHVGSLIVDDVQDHSDIRRGGPALHRLYGEALAINAGCASYFLAQVPVGASGLDAADRVAIYEAYFEAMRAGHTGQAFDIDGFARLMPEVVETGDGRAARAARAGGSPLEVRGAPGRARAHGGADRRRHGGADRRARRTVRGVRPRVPDHRRRAEPARVRREPKDAWGRHHRREGDRAGGESHGALIAGRSARVVGDPVCQADFASGNRPCGRADRRLRRPRCVRVRGPRRRRGSLADRRSGNPRLSGQDSAARIRLVRARPPLLTRRPMYALLTAIPLVGHINPLLRQAEELQRRGWHVAFAGAREVQRHVAAEAPAVPFVDLGPLGPITADLRRAQVSASLDSSFVRGTQRIVESLWAVWPSMFDGLAAAFAAHRPDVVVADLFSSAGISAADATGIPCVVNNPDLLGVLSPKLLPPADHLPFLFSGRSRHDVRRWQTLVAPLVRHLAVRVTSSTVGRRLNQLRASRGLAPVDVHEMLRDRQVLVDGAFGLEYPRPLPANVAMVGAMLPDVIPPLPPELAAWLSDGPPVVYVNLGTLAVAPSLQLQKMAAALTHDRFRALWILASDQTVHLPAPLRPGVRVLEWGPPPLAVLAHPNVAAFVSHCGINSVYESVRAGTPIVGLPMFADQRDMAARVADAGIGLWLDKRRFTADQLRTAVLNVMTVDSFRQALPRVQQALADAGGVRRAADLIERAASARSVA